MTHTAERLLGWSTAPGASTVSPAPERIGRRSVVVVGIAGLALSVARVAEATGQLTGGIARLDVATTVLLVLATAVVARPWVAAIASGTPLPSMRRHLRAWLVPLYAVWFPVVVLGEVMVDPTAGPRTIAASMLLFRDPRVSGPLPGLGIGPLLTSVAIVIVVVPLAVTLLRGRWRPLQLAAGLVGSGLVIRTVLVATDRTAPFGALSWLPAHLDAVGVGLGLAALLHGGHLMSSRTRWAVAASTAAVFVAAAIALPRTLLLVEPLHIWVHGLAATVIGAGVVVLVWTWPVIRSRGGRRRVLDTTASAVAAGAPGLLLAHEMAFVLLARQHRERFTDGPFGVRLTGPALPIWLWSVVLAGALGVLLAVTVFGSLRRWWPVGRSTDEPWAWGRDVDPFPVLLAAVVSGALVVRVATWLAVAPERTDGGDPLFYHVTANTIAAGRGFPEPLNWLDSATEIPSALHGPLYPVVLSLSSRLGGTTYVDHKFVSILIGTVTVLLVGLVARRLAGRTVALVAAALAAVYPNLWLIDSLLFPEGLFAMLTTACILVAYQWRDRPTLWRAALLGVLIGLAGLTRGEGLLLGVLLAMPWMLRHRDLTLQVRWQHLVLAGVACITVLAPWTIRNISTFEEFVPLSTNGNELIMYANCDDVYRGKLIGYWSFDCQERHRAEFGEPPGDESEKAVYWRRVGLEYAREHLDEVPKVVAARVLRQWELFRPWQTIDTSTIEGRDRTSATLGLVMYYALVGGAVVGAVLLRRRGERLLPLGAQVLGVTVTAIYAYGTVRFRAPVEPVLCVLAAVPLVPLATRLRRSVFPPDLLVALDPEHDGSAYVLGGSGGLRRTTLGARRTWAGIAVVLAAVAFPLGGLYRSTGGTMEEGFMLLFPERMWAGDVPNVDFLHLYGPGALHVLMGWYQAFGFTLEAERTFGLLQHLGIIFALFALARPWGRVAATSVATLSTLLILTPIGLTAMAWNGALALTLWAVIIGLRAGCLADARDRRIHWLATGALGGLALTFRPDLVLAVALVGAFFWWRERTAWRPLLIGGVVGAVPMWIHLAVAGPRASFEGMVIDPVIRLRPGRELPSPPSWDRLDGSLQAIAELVPPWWGLPALPASVSLYLWFWAMLIVAAGLVVVAVALYRRTDGSPRSVVLVAGSLVGLGIVPQALQRPDSTHLSWVACISWPLAVLAIAEVIRMRRPRTHPRTRVAVGAIAVATALFVVAPLFTYRYYLTSTRISVGQRPGAFPVERDGRRFYLGDLPPYRASRDVIATLDELAVPGERLFVGPSDLRRTWYNDTFFYWMFPELEPATYFTEMDPGLANAVDSGLADDVASADWIILTSFWDGWFEPNTSMEFGPDEPNQVIREQFCLVASFEDGLVTLHRRCR